MPYMDKIDTRASRRRQLRGWPATMEDRTVDGVPLTSDRAEAPAPDDAGPGTSGVYRPRYELVAEEILQLIGELLLRPGDRMPTEKELASRLGTSRTVVRDAVKILSATGRVSAQKGRGLYVADNESMLGARQWGGFFVPPTSTTSSCCSSSGVSRRCRPAGSPPSAPALRSYG